MKKGTILVSAILVIIAVAVVLRGTTEESHPRSDPAQAGEEKTAIGSNDAWPASTPEDQGMDSNVLYTMMTKLMQSKTDSASTFDSILILRNGQVVTELYSSRMTPDALHPVHSMTKSVTSAVFGAALREGLIGSVDDKLLDYFPEYKAKMDSTAAAEKENIKLRHVLTMSDGLEWDEFMKAYDENNSAVQLRASRDPVQYVLDKKVALDPGSTFNYNTGDSQLLSEIIARKSGTNAIEYAKKSLFEPLGIEHFLWETMNDGVAIGGANLYMTTRDFAKIGLLYLNKGRWGDQSIVSEQWVRESSVKHVDLTVLDSDGYGYQWWINQFGGYSARGLDGQYLFVMPEQNLVAVFFSKLNQSGDFQLPLYIMEGAVLDSIVSAEKIPPNPQLAELENQVKEEMK